MVSETGVDSESSISKLVAMVPKFNGEKFNLYKYKLKLVMEPDDMWKIVTGQVTRSEDPATAAVYDKKAQAAMTIIVFTLEDSLLHHIKDVSSPKDAWDILEGEYEPKRTLQHRLSSEAVLFLLHEVGRLHAGSYYGAESSSE